MSRYWYTYDPAAGSAFVAASYTRLDIGKPTCLNGTEVCAIYAPAGDVTPFDPLSNNIQQYITAGLASGGHVAQPQIGKKYVYLRT